MEKNLEKNLKRYLKRKVKITLGFIVAFLLSCNFVSAEGLYIQNNADTGEIEFSKDNSTWGKNPYSKNSFINNIYTNNIELKTDGVALVNMATGISLINNGEIITKSNDETLGTDNTGISNTDRGVIKNLSNNGNIKIENQFGYVYGISNNGTINQFTNNGIIEAKSYARNEGNDGAVGISSSGTIETLISNGNIKVNSLSGTAVGITSTYGKINKLINAGTIEATGNKDSTGIFFYAAENENILNEGIVFTKNEKSKNSVNGLYLSSTSSEKIYNSGIISTIGSSPENTVYFCGIEYNEYNKVPHIINIGIIKNYIGENAKSVGISIEGNSEINNKGTILSKSNNASFGIDIEKEIKNLKNSGIISVKGSEEDTSTIHIKSYNNSEIKDLINNGILYSDKKVIYNSNKISNITNNGLFIGNLEKSLSDNKTFNKGFTFKVENGKYTEINKAENSGDITNTDLIENGETGTKSIDFTDKTETGKIFNGITDTLAVKGTSSLTDGTVNGYTNAVVFDEAGGELTLNKSIINGGIAENSFAVKGQKGNDSLSFLNETIINGNTNLGAGNDTLNLSDTVQINGTLDGGDGTDSLNFGISKNDNVSTFAENEKSSLNILYDITNFENTEINTKVTLFEKTINDKGDIENLSAQLGNITITENRELVLRVDGTEKDTEGKVTGHALYGNKGSITAENGGKLTLNTFGFGESEIVDFKETDLSNLKEENIKLSSVLHKGKIGEDNTITVSAKKDLEDLDIADYDKLNKIYHSILNSENVDKFTVEEEQYGAFTKYLHDIYAGNPYAYSSELSRKTMSMMKNLSDKDLNPELNKWAIYGGLTHTDGGTENSYYGKGYYTYDIGSRDISADTKITGAYFKAEYGKSDTVTTGIIFGGNNSETEIGASKVEGDSFYFGTYAKKYLNNFRFTLGAGFEHGDYKADRTAIGYDGITETKNYSENYHDRGFNIYGDLKYSKELGNNFFFEPSVTLEYSYVDQDKAGEDGILAIETDSKTFDYMTGTVNLDLRKEIKKDKFTHSLTAGVSYERMLSGYDEEYITGRIKGGTDFDILVPEKEKDIFSLNAKYELETERGFIFDVKGSYRFEHDTNKDEWIVGTGVGYKF